MIADDPSTCREVAYFLKYCNNCFMGCWRFQVSFMTECIIPFYDRTKELVTGYKGAIRKK
jgi:hypothetical protein